MEKSKILILIGALLFLLSGCSNKEIKVPTSNEISLDKQFNKIRNNTPMLVNFLKSFPKGADLHNHASGAAYIEYGLIYAATRASTNYKYLFNIENQKIIDVNKILIKPYDKKSKEFKAGCEVWTEKTPCLISIKSLLSKSRTKTLEKYLDIVSVRGWHKGTTNGQDHFFNAFNHTFKKEKNEYLASIIARNHNQGVRYIELMTSVIDKELISKLDKLLPEKSFNINDLDNNYNKIASFLNSTSFENNITSYMYKQENSIDTILREKYALTIKGETPDIIVRYIPQLYRLQSLHNTFINAAANIKSSKIDKRIVATNMVQNEAGISALMNFNDQMKILDFFWKTYNQPNIALHAGELVLRESPLEPMRNRISQSIILGHASRIGHGVSIAWEDDVENTLKMMHKQKIAVEICLSSNDIILGISGNNHPLAMYKKANVPITLATDDEGISRSNLTMEYVKAAQNHNLSYSFLKRIAKNGLEYSFLKGESIYSKNGNIIEKYKKYLSNTLPSVSITGLKAYLQIRHERDIAAFENKMFDIN